MFKILVSWPVLKHLQKPTRIYEFLVLQGYEKSNMLWY